MRSYKTLVSIVKKTIREDFGLPQKGEVTITETPDCTALLLQTLLQKHIENPLLSFTITQNGSLSAEFLEQYCDRKLSHMLKNTKDQADSICAPFRTITRYEIESLCISLDVPFDCKPSDIGLLETIPQTSIHHGLQKSLESIDKTLNAK